VPGRDVDPQVLTIAPPKAGLGKTATYRLPENPTSVNALLIRRSAPRIRPVRRNPYPQVMVHLVSDAGAPGPVLSNQSVRKR